jgi:hypothetical protein
MHAIETQISAKQFKYRKALKLVPSDIETKKTMRNILRLLLDKSGERVFLDTFL